MIDCRVDLVSRTNVHFLVFHLTLADAVISFITMPMETIWRVVIEVVLLLYMTFWPDSALRIYALQARKVLVAMMTSMRIVKER